MRNDIMEKVKQHRYMLGYYIHDEMLDKFNENAYKIINDIKENGKKANNKQWEQWVKSSKGNKDIQNYIAIYPHTPEYALHLLLNTGRTYQDTCIDLFKRENLNDILIGKTLTKSNNNTVESLAVKMGIPEENINPKVIDMIAKVVVDWLKDNDGEIKGNSKYFSALEFTKQETLILELYNSGVEIPETALNKIASNQNLSDFTRNKIFDLGVDFEQLTSMTKHMAKTIYESAIDSAIDDGTKPLYFNDPRRRALHALEIISNCKAMDDSMIIDMINRIYEKDLTPFQSKISPIETALQKTNSSYIIDYLYDFSKKFDDEIGWKKYLMQFNTTSNDTKEKIIKDAIDNYYEKYNEVGTAYRSTAYESGDIDFISNHLSLLNLGNYTYNKLFDLLEDNPGRKRQWKELRASVASCPYIAISILEKINDKGMDIGFNNEHQFYARINRDLRNAGLSDYIIHTTNAYRLDYTNAYDIKDMETAQKIKDIFEQNVNKITDENVKKEFVEKLEIFDNTMRNIDFNERMDSIKSTDSIEFYQGVRKNCEVYTYIDDLIDSIEKKEKSKEKEKEEER